MTRKIKTNPSVPYKASSPEILRIAAEAMLDPVTVLSFLREPNGRTRPSNRKLIRDCAEKLGLGHVLTPSGNATIEPPQS